MYIQITTKCDMACAHCCFGCRPGIGVDMSFRTFRQACRVAHEYGSPFCIGGGEPTLHPYFWTFLTHALETYHADGSEDGRVSDEGMQLLIVTNGSQTKTALRLARLCEDGFLNAVLSQDQWHNPIHPEVVAAYKHLKRAGKEGIRSNTNITPHGSALKNSLHTSTDECCCHDQLISPKGTIWGCGCRKAKWGTVWDFTVPPDFEWHECAVKQKANAV